MHGVRLAELEAADMIDVLHYMFETDYTPMSEESARSRSSMRETIYPSLYKYPYHYSLPKDTEHAAHSRSSAYSDIDLDVEDEPLPDPFSPQKKEIKPFTPATDFNPESPNPFGRSLDPPLK